MGKYSGLFTGTAKEVSKVTPERLQLQSAKQSAQTRLATSPAIVGSGKYSGLFKRTEDIAAGKPTPARGALGLFGGGAMKALEGIGYVLGTPARGVASIAKETTDLLEGKGFSPKDLVSQTLQKDFYASKFIPKTGVKWLDSASGFAVDVLGDPLTYVTFGGSAWMGKSGRIALAAKAAEAQNLAKMPSLAGKLEEIARLGVHANLDDAERALLGAQKGVSWTFGKGKGQVIGKEGSALRKASDVIGSAVGRPTSKLRASIGDLPFLEPVQKVITRKFVGDAGLTNLGRKGADFSAKEIVEKLGGWSAAQRTRGVGNAFIARVSSANSALGKELSDWEASTGLKVAHLIEGEIPATPENAAIMEKVTNFFADLADKGDAVLQDYASRRGVRVFNMNRLQEYVPHTLSEGARKWLASKRWRGTKYESGVKRMLDLSPDEMIKGPSIMRARKLVPAAPGEEPVTWLGQEIKRGTIKEINDISEKVLGFKWFEDDIASVMNSYINSMGTQVKRVTFADRLFDYGVDVADAIAYKWIPDANVVKAWESSTNSWQKALRIALGEEYKLGSQAAGVMRKAQNVARGIVQDNNTKLILSQKEISALQAQLTEALGELDKAAALAAERGGFMREQFETLAAPYRARLQAVSDALASNDQMEIAATMYLEEAHARMFPRMKKRPTDPRVMAEQILAKSESRTASRLKALETRKERLERSIGPRGKKGRAAKAAEGELDAAAEELQRINAEIDFLNDLAELSSREFPGGVVYVSRFGLDDVASGRRAGLQVFNELPEGADPNDFLVSFAPNVDSNAPYRALPGRIISPVDDEGDYRDFVADLGDGIGLSIRKLGDVQGAEVFGAQLDGVIGSQGGGIRPMSPIWVDAEPELASIIGIIDEMGRKDFANVATPAQTASELNDDLEQISGLLDSWLSRQMAEKGAPGDVFEDGADMLYEAISNAGSPTVGFSDIVGVNLGDLAIGGEQVGIVLNGQIARNIIDEVPDSVRRAIGTPGFDPVMDLMSAQGARDVASSMVATTRQAFEDASAAVKATKAEAAKVGRQIGGVKGAASRLEGRVSGAAEDVRRAAEEVPIPDGKGGTKLVSRDKAMEQMGLDARKIARDERKLANAIKNDPLTRQERRAAGTVGRVEASMNSAKALRGEAAEWEQTYGAAYRDDLVQLDEVLSARPPKGASAEINQAWYDQMEQVVAQIRNPDIFSPEQTAALERIFAQRHGQEAQIAMLEQYVDFGKLMTDKAKTGEIGGRLVEDIREGWGGIEALGIQMPQDLRDMLFGRIERLKDPREFNKFIDSYFRYQRFFKVTAMLTPGFIVRNAMTAAFNNYVAGVSTADNIAGIQFSQNALKHGSDKALKMVPQAERKLYEDAFAVFQATGGGQTADDFFYPIASSKGQRWLNSKLVSKWRGRNEQVEMAARMAMALSSLKRDLGFDGAVAEVARYHFDYTDLSRLDEFAKMFIPFWTFASRNIPLQIVNQIARPGLYRAYDSLERNFEVDKNLVLAPWMQANRPISGPGGRILMPDLPFIDMENQLRMFADPMRLASQLNPAIKLPVELVGNRQLGLDIPFSEKPYEVRGPLDYPSALAGSLFGQTTTTPEGQMITSSKAGYALPSLLPTLAQFQRLVPQLGGKETYVARQPYSILSAGLGIPLRGVSEEEQANELIRRQFALRNFLSNLTRTGYLEPKD